MTTLVEQAFNASGLSVQEYAELIGVPALTMHRWFLGTLKQTARETEISARILKGTHRHGSPEEVRRMVLETLKGDYLTALAVLLIDGAYSK